MSKIWGEISKATSIGVQFVKEKTGVVKAEVNPQFENAAEKFQILLEQLTTFKSDVEVILQSAQSAANAGVEMCKSLSEADQAIGGASRPVIQPITEFFNKNNSMLNEHLVGLVNTNVLQNFNQYIEDLKHLKELKEKRVKTALYVASLKNDIENYSKDGKSEKLTKAKIEYEQQNDDLIKSTNEFIASVNNLWNTRVQILESAMFEFVGIAYTYSQFLYGNLQIMQNQMPK